MSGDVADAGGTDTPSNVGRRKTSASLGRAGEDCRRRIGLMTVRFRFCNQYHHPLPLLHAREMWGLVPDVPSTGCRHLSAAHDVLVQSAAALRFYVLWPLGPH